MATTHNAHPGDILNVNGVHLEIVEADNAPLTQGIALKMHVPLCRACGENDAEYADDGIPFCPTCVSMAQLHVLLEMPGDENNPLTRVVEWDNENARVANIAGEQYIDLRSSALDWVSAMPPAELLEEVRRYMRELCPMRVRTP